MSETSRSRVTITLGRTGQVVKRDGISPYSSNAEYKPLVGSKRPVRQRLENSIDSTAPLNNKRLRRDDEADIAVEGIHLRKDDLRYKIIQKNFKKSQNNPQNGMDLRNFLSRPAQSSTNSISAQEKLPEPKDARPQYLEPRDGRHYTMEPKDGRHYTMEPRDGRHLMPVTRISSQQISKSGVQHLLNPRARQLPEAREGGRLILKPEDGRQHMPEISRSSMMPGISGPRSANDMAKMESGIDSFSTWTLDHLRRKSPNEAVTISRVLPSPMSDEGLLRRYTVGAADGSRTSTYIDKDAFQVSRPVSSSYLSKMALPVGSTKTMSPLVSTRPLPGCPAQNIPYVMDDHLTVDIFLRSLGLEKYAILFKAEEVDMYSLKRMSESDIKELGIPMGPRKKILLSLQTQLKRPAYS